MKKNQGLVDGVLRQHCAENKGGEKQVSWVTPDQGSLSKMERSHAIWGQFLGNVFVENPSFSRQIAGKAFGGKMQFMCMWLIISYLFGALRSIISKICLFRVFMLGKQKHKG